MKLALTLCLLALPVSAECYNWPLSGEPYDGDTFAVTVPGLPDELARVSVRVRGVDTPEIEGACGAEKEAAIRARNYTSEWLSGGYEICSLEWGKYGGRVVADVVQESRILAQDLIVRGLGREYNGGARKGWCDDQLGD
ncbi:thermonuclease family protein [Thalassospira sp.]|uniref:thermonuclease family protein n=1 Tax=Thalassospira sp. TaxID=1912094 RepID=UPI001B22A82E|nr:thermonuclease family protein [Thalassospira sp.]MBO6808469.1 thermonuclease family protein [Thalassospira sp.]MBO6839833.1 thermonuclease family protein [Thalassospira sp.]